MMVITVLLRSLAGLVDGYWQAVVVEEEVGGGGAALAFLWSFQDGRGGNCCSCCLRRQR